MACELFIKMPMAAMGLHCYVKKTQMCRLNFRKDRKQSFASTFSIWTGAKNQPKLNIRHGSPESVRLLFIYHQEI